MVARRVERHVAHEDDGQALCDFLFHAGELFGREIVVHVVHGDEVHAVHHARREGQVVGEARRDARVAVRLVGGVLPRASPTYFENSWFPDETNQSSEPK